MKDKQIVNAVITCGSFEKCKNVIPFKELKRQAYNVAIAYKRVTFFTVCDSIKKGNIERYCITPGGCIKNLDTGEMCSYKRINPIASWI